MSVISRVDARTMPLIAFRPHAVESEFFVTFSFMVLLNLELDRTNEIDMVLCSGSRHSQCSVDAQSMIHDSFLASVWASLLPTHIERCTMGSVPHTNAPPHSQNAISNKSRQHNSNDNDDDNHPVDTVASKMFRFSLKTECNRCRLANRLVFVWAF